MGTSAHVVVVGGDEARLIDTASFEDIAWKKKAPGVAICDVRLPANAKGQLKLLRIGAGRAMPEHGHGGEEITLVLKGAYRDHMGRFGQGDVAAVLSERNFDYSPAFLDQPVAFGGQVPD